MTTLEQLQAAQSAKNVLASADTQWKNNALFAMADSLETAQKDILAANQKDLSAAKGVISEVMLDRLALSSARIRDMAQGIRAVADLPDPVGRVLSEELRPNGLVIRRTRVPMGVVAIIYESRPNVTSDVAALTIKSGECLHTALWKRSASNGLSNHDGASPRSFLSWFAKRSCHPDR